MKLRIDKSLATKEERASGRPQKRAKEEKDKGTKPREGEREGGKREPERREGQETEERTNQSMLENYLFKYLTAQKKLFAVGPTFQPLSDQQKPERIVWKPTRPRYTWEDHGGEKNMSSTLRVLQATMNLETNQRHSN